MMRAAEMIAAPEWGPWAEWSPSVLASHEGECCALARGWFLAMSRSLWRGEGGPTWIANRYPWGPSRWPLYWCQAVEAEELDCGAHQALTVEAFRDRGLVAVPAQLAQRQERHNQGHFHGRWKEGGGAPEWAGDGVAYHEAVAVIADGRVEVWDATVNAWLSPTHLRGVRSIAGIRIGGPVGETLSWRGVQIPVGEWVSPAHAARLSSGGALAQPGHAG